MELTDSNDSKPETRSPLGIDLNEIPSSSFSETLPDADSAEPDSFSIVRAIHENPDPAPGDPAGVPVGKEDEPCGACGTSAAAGGGRVVVCDGCERGFHLACAGIPGRLSAAEEWVCVECVGRGVRSKRWPLGLKAKKRILDINASPPSDGDCDGEEVQELSRKHTPGDNSFVGNGFGAPLTYSNFLYAGNGFGFHKSSGIMTHAVKVGFEDILCHTRTRDRSFDAVDLGFPLGGLSSNNTAIRFPSRNPSDILLQALREYVSARHGVLEEGWRVELKHSMSSCELYAVYCAPDGKTFDSVLDVACHLGLMPNYNSMDAEIKLEGASLQERLHLPKKRKSTRFSVPNGFPENKESLISGHCKELLYNGQSVENGVNKFGLMKVTEAMHNEKDSSQSEQIIDGLPMQFEDFFVLSLGQVDMRPSYHDASLIFPIGYRSCWHDKITGSLFICEVSDGGDCGPIFKVRRCSCSAFPLPIASTVLYWPRIQQIYSHNNEGVAAYYNIKDFGDDDSIQMILSDPCPPIENDILTCLGSTLKERCVVQNFDRSQPEAVSICDKYGELLMDEIGEILVEERSLSSAWRLMSQKFIDAYSEIRKRKGTLKFLCKHAGMETGSAGCDMMDEKNIETYTPLAKFCGFPVPPSIPFDHEADKPETLVDELTKWLGQDRFGLEAEFVQEIIEELPGVKACSRYESLKNRSSYSGSLTIRNGFLKVKTKDGLECEGEKGLGVLFGRSKKPRLVYDRGPPAGKPLCMRLPSELVGDFHQVWELLWRFREVMGLKEPLFANELEEELINPWSTDSNLLHKFDGENQGTDTLSISRVDGMGEQNGSASDNPSVATSSENQRSFIQMETGEEMEADLASLANRIYRRCFGMTLTKAHSSLLGVLISELQSKVAALVDPNFDSGESRSKRGRKKDLDSIAPAKRVKLSVLPINELTWPEIARRYLLAVLSMDGNLDSAEITARESGKVFRCLHGDGGVLCGSLTGVAGMEADALLLAEATKRIFGSLNVKSDVLTLEDEGPDENVACEKNVVNDGDIPEWAKLLEPVRKLPTNVGTRIRRCVNEALENDPPPPEWAKKILEHSISKEVYKGNASGPTKKAVLSVLADIHNECLVKKSEKGRSKKKTIISVSDIIMKECRIILRRAAAADDSKIFCNLLGRKLMNSGDNDDEGLLGSPAMVSRPLDFRTIDLRLAVGAYGGSHEAFLEDVRELWRNVRTAYSDQPDLVELAESLSQNFESLYEQEVLTLVQKLEEYAKLECLSAETKEEINDIRALTSEIPKAPWDEGVCKVCGIDKDDDSVLLCDTCDAEYHTYCLNPPLARIPEGNWYCPSCVVSKRMVQNASEHCQVIIRQRGKKYQGEVTRGYLEALAHLATTMEGKEYWQFSIDERTFLLKFLCDELLNTALIRQHLEQCAEATSELHQKLRSACVEWKNLKSREDFVAARAAKIDTSMTIPVGDIAAKDGDPLPPDGGKEGGEFNGSIKSASATLEKNLTTNGQVLNTIDSEARLKGDHPIVDASHVSSKRSDKSSRPSELPVSNHLPQEIEDPREETSFQGKLEDSKRMDVAPPQSPSDCNGQCLPSDVTSLHTTKPVPCVAENELQSHHFELNTIRSDIQHLQDLITSLESQLLKLSVRKEFLGSDSAGRLYWISAIPGGYPQVIVDGSLALQKKRNFLGYEDQVHNTSVNWKFTSASRDTGTRAEGSRASCPFLYNSKDAISVGSPWVTYQKDAEIEGLVDWLNDNDPKEKELKEAVLQKLKFQDYQKMKKQVQDESQTDFSMSNCSDNASFSTFLVTKAAMLLEKKYGPCFESEITDFSKKRGKKVRMVSEDNMYRCKCLEPIWPSRNHCISCHKTFLSDVEFENHNEGGCNLGPPANEKGKSVGESSKGKKNLNFDINRVDCAVDMEIRETSRIGHSGLSSRLIKFQNEGAICPYDFEEISTKFVTRDSNEELVREIGLIGSNGVPSFVSSVTHFVGDSTLMIVPPHQGNLGDELKATDRPVYSQGKRSLANGIHEGLSDDKFRRSATDEIGVQKTKRPALRCFEQSDRISSSNKYSSELGIGRCCVVPQSSLRPFAGKVSLISRQLKINLLDMDAALPEEAFKPSKACLERRWTWRSFVKSAETIYEMVQATIVLEDMIKTEFLRNEWWYWSSLSAAAKVSTISSLALRIYSLDAAIIYEKSSEFHAVDSLKPSSIPDLKMPPSLDLPEKCKVSRKTSKKRKEPEG
ncbi:hypothetical protein CCACVL1_12795 [Corchorus capsularis]|uniref:Zinc finger, PHD-type n=1 Tax=Corchorus capsularis TaxID=210143 RepID=A0A1R3IDS6_COCAP|nr:hypothetical protein CCACVL1_12795 [Corchorus capsularis]